MLTRIDHVGIACHSLDSTIDFYRRTYGFEVAHVEVNEEQGVREAMLRVNGTDDGGASYLQLLEPIREDSPVAAFLARKGEGVHHIAFGTPDVAAEAGSVAENGVRVLDAEPRREPWGPRSRSSTPRTAGVSSPSSCRRPETTNRPELRTPDPPIPGRGQA